MFTKRCNWTGIIRSALIAFVIAFILILFFYFQGNSKIENKGFSRMIVYESSSCLLTGLDVDNLSGNTTEVRKAGNSSCHFDLYLNESIFFNSHPEALESTTYPKMKIPANGVESLYPLAVDFVNKKVYGISYIDGETYKLFVMDFNDHTMGKYAIVLSDLDLPKDLTLDPTVSVLFIVQQSSILRVSMDGSSPTIILKVTGLAPAICIDRSAKRIYWASLSQIESMDYAGNNRRVGLKLYMSPPTSLAVLGGRLFWLAEATSEKALWTCSQNETTGACASVQGYTLKHNHQIGQMKAYNFTELEATAHATPNPCQVNNGGCAGMCLLSNVSSEGYSCACELGWELGDDGKSCQRSGDNGLLYVQNFFVRVRRLDRLGIGASEESSFSETIYPVNLLFSNVNKSKPLRFAYDLREHLFYYINGDTMREVDMSDIRKKQFEIDSIANYEVHLATDWVSKLIYVSMSSFDNLSRKNFLRVYPYGYSSNNRNHKTLVNYGSEYTLRSVAVHPNRGRVFFILTDLASNTSGLVRVNSDGSGRQLFLENRRVGHVGLAIDFYEDRLYWFSEDGSKLESVDIDGGIDSLRSIDVSMVTRPTSMTFDKTHLYVSNNTSAWRLTKATGKAAVYLRHVNPEAREVLAGVSFYNASAQPVVDSHPCAVNRGGCKTFCFGIPVGETQLKKQCDCFDGKKLQPDGRSCA